MQPLSAPPVLSPGDVIHHPVRGLAIVVAVESVSVDSTSSDSPGSPSEEHVLLQYVGARAAVPILSLGLGWRRCEGLLAALVREPAAALNRLKEAPAAALAELRADLSDAELESWLVGGGLVEPALWQEWWSVAAREGILLSPPGSLPASEAFSFALELTQVMAKLHAEGRTLLRLRSAVRRYGDGYHIQERPTSSPEDRREDVRFLMRLVIEQLIGPLPPGEQLHEAELPFLVARPDIPLELLAVAVESLSHEPDDRPANGLALLERLTIAQAMHGLRNRAPWQRDARLAAGFDTHIGLFKSLMSQTNQDAFLVVGDPDLAMFAVADGISLCTAGSGDRASQLMIRSLRHAWNTQGSRLRHATSEQVHAFLVQALRDANTSVCEGALKAADGDLSRHVPMGTTVLVALSLGNRVHLAALGDSRAYLIGVHGVAPLTYDQNLQSSRLRAHLAGRNVQWDEPGHALLGYGGHFDAEGHPALPEVYARTVTVLPGEWLVLCTDGFSDYAAAEESGVVRVLQQAIKATEGAANGPTAMDLARRLVSFANRGGGGDNVTVLAFTLSNEGPTDVEMSG